MNNLMKALISNFTAQAKSNKEMQLKGNNKTKLTSAQMQDSFILLSRAAPDPSPPAPSEEHRGNLSHRLKVTNRLFDLISGVSKLDHPMCNECAEVMVQKLDGRLIELRQEKVLQPI